MTSGGAHIGRWLRGLWLAAFVVFFTTEVLSHSGPPFPIVSDRAAGPYTISIWTDPDATDDGSAAGQFWVTVHVSDKSALPEDTRVNVAIRPTDREGAPHAGQATPVKGDRSNQFVALLMDHEGPFAVQATIASARGSAVVDATVDATYDLRPARWLFVIYVMPFVAVGFLWIKLLMAKRGAGRRA